MPTCKICGQEFETRHRKERRSCYNPECRLELRRLVRREQVSQKKTKSKSKVITRQCLQCDTTFKTMSRFIRICKDCKDVSEYSESGAEFWGATI